MNNSIKFSVLLSVYRREKPEFLEIALNSIENQILQANEIVLVKDGPLTTELDEVVDRHTKNTNMPYKIVSLQENLGLGPALNKGLEECSFGWIARMDTDDIALPDRFEKQMAYLATHISIDVLGGWICEFDEEPSMCTKERRVPNNNEDIVKFAKYRNPMNHMTVVFRKSAVDEAGGYATMNGFEDYYLWMRMLMKGKQFANIAEVLLKARTGKGMIHRRQGWKYAMDELALEKTARRIGFWTAFDLARNFFVRFLPRLLPVFIVEKLYNILRKF